jgi:hypothetical protein
MRILLKNWYSFTVKSKTINKNHCGKKTILSLFLTLLNWSRNFNEINEVKTSNTSDLRVAIEQKLRTKFGLKVLHGPYKNMSLHEENYWGLDNPSMRFGIYEQEVLNEIRKLNGKKFVNIGAGDGYYAV